MRNYKLAAIPVDGIGPEVIDAGIEVLKALQACRCDFQISLQHF